MNATEEFLIEAFKEQGLLSEELLQNFLDEVNSLEPSQSSGDAGLDLINIASKNLGLSKEEITTFLAGELGMQIIDLSQISPPDQILSLLSPELARQYEAIPIGDNGSSIDLILGNPVDQDGIEDLSHVLGRSINPWVACREDILALINQIYGVAESEKEQNFLEGLNDQNVQIGDGDMGQVSEEDAPIIKYVHSLIKDALEMRASDIHMEPLEKKFRIRYRIDGKLQEQQDPPKRLQPSIISRTKLMANVSLAEKRVPLDGRINVQVGEKVIDLRVSTLPTVHGESIVMRILDKESLSLGLPQLGFFSDDQSVFEKVINMPDGIFLVTGPTGSGKSTTLYSALNTINKPDRKIITVEDPVEYEVPGINQVQVRSDVGMTFSAALRAMLRQAPNIVMVGEIRDLETAEIAINASLTGHMVFSTLHTNDAPSAVSRLIDMGVKPFLVSASLRAALAQRLVRSICQNCKQPYQPSQSELSVLGLTAEQAEGASFMRGEGCPKCGDKGYRGRKGVFEIFVVNQELEEMIYNNVSIVELRKKAREMGMRSMREDGYRKVMAGVTTLDEVLMVTTEEE